MAIAAHEITLEGFDRSFKLLDFQMELKPNAHGWAKLLLRLKEKPDLLQELLHDTKLTIGYSTNEGASGTLFSGILENVAMKRKDQYYELAIDLITGSAVLDRETKQMAYQDGAMTYSQIVARVLAETAGAKVIAATESDPVTDGMLIQYMETDWAFVQRLASHLGEAVFPDWFTGSPAAYFGTQMNTGQATVALNNYTIAVDQRFYEQGGFLAGLSKRDFLYYRIETDADYVPGTRANIQGRDCRVWYKRGELHGDQIEFTYHWGEAYIVKRQDNEDLIGAMFSGTVLETIDERVRIALDIDAVGTTTFHPWAPVTGNIFYCMPELGNRVMLYCGSRLESSAKATENVRENGGIQSRAEDNERIPTEQDYHRRLLNHNNRFFASKDGKELSILPDGMGLGPREAMPKILMADGTGIRIEDTTLTLEAGGAIAFQGDMIRVQAPSQVSMIRSGGGAISTFDICNNFNASGTIGSMRSTNKVAMRIPESSVVEELGAIDTYIAACIAAIPLGLIGESAVNRTKEKLLSLNEQTLDFTSESARGFTGEQAAGRVRKNALGGAMMSHDIELPYEMQSTVASLAASALSAIPTGSAKGESLVTPALNTAIASGISNKLSSGGHV